MASLKVQRGPVRAAFTRVLNDIQAEVDKGEGADKTILLKLLRRLEGHQGKLVDLDERIGQGLLADKADEEEFTTEYESVTDYRDKFSDISVVLNSLIMPEESAEATASIVQNDIGKSRYRLPKLEFRKFSGEPKEWLGFWSQFKCIHEDERMVAEEKFQYLVQATVERSKAREVIDSFPPTAENYPKVVDYLKTRFGKEEVLVEVYVRDLLRLVLNNTMSKDKLPISSLYDQLETQLRALESLGVTSDKYAAMLYPLVESSLPEETLRAWERSRIQGGAEANQNRLTLLMRFLQSEVDSELRIRMAQAGFSESQGKSDQNRNRKGREQVSTAADLFGGESSKSTTNPGCIFCDGRHPSNDCYKAQKMTLAEKSKIVREKNGCFNCIRRGHFSSKCKFKPHCQVCGGKHFVIMCPELSKHKVTRSASPTEKDEGNKDSALASHCTGEVLLQTLSVYFRCGKQERIARALIDTGSQNSYITQRAVDVLGFKPAEEVKLSHSLFGGQQTREKVHFRYNVEVESLDRKFHCNLSVLDEQKICGTISRVSQGPWISELRNRGITVTDVGRDTPDIHLLIGADVAGKLLTGRIHQTRSGPVGVQTKLGWTVMGRDVDIQDLWKLDVIGIHDPVETKTRLELTESATQHFKETVTRNVEDRYEVSLPWIEGHPPLSTYRELAEKRLQSATKRLENLGKVSQYENIFNEWSEMGIIEQVPENEVEYPSSYLPHRPVFNPKSTTTPIRPVFDASARTKNSPSLNDCLEKGPNLIELVPSILVRFRMKRYGMVSDIAKAFLQISVKKKDRDFLRFLWWEKDRRKRKIFRHCRVVFGVSSSPFLLAATINHHLDGVGEELVETAQLLKRSLYVDNCIASVDTIDDLNKFVKESTEIMSTAKFNLRGWIWNESADNIAEVTGVSPPGCGLVTGNVVPEEEVPVLGLTWNVQRDILKLDLRSTDLTEEFEVVTKRKILSAAHRVFDPIGFSCPVTLVPKMLLQEVWKLKLSWDEEVPEDIGNRFRVWFKKLPELLKIEIPRWVLTGDSMEWTLHVFTDASKGAYAACVFLRNETSKGVEVQLLMARSRVSTTKTITIPRLELLGCTMGARLAYNVKEMIGNLNVKTFFWTDSSNALFWIRKNQNWGAFVYNRREEIRKLSQVEDWNHVSGEDNPADLPSRGCMSGQLLSSRWWEGPAWLKLSKEDWPKSEVQCDLEVVMAEKKKTVVSQVAIKGESPWYLIYFSSFRRVVRMLAWMLRWRCKRTVKGPLTVVEEAAAEKVLLKLVQTESFKEGDRILKQLNAEKDSVGIWRVNTKIVMREDTDDFRRPILLPVDHKLVKMLIFMEHVNFNHCGVKTLMSRLREKYWIIQSRRAIGKVISSCGRCRRYVAKKTTVIEAPLPMDRVRDAAVFEVVGIDLAGPLYLKDTKKAWFVVYTCAVYRAVHFELVTSLSSEAFLQSLRRFISRRGRPSTVYTDNGTNFRGTSNELKKLDWKKIEEETFIQQIKWIFNPPSAPWWGGWWERVVGMVKQLLRRILGRALLDYEEMVTVLCDCEQTINSRPLTYLSEDPGELVPLTPSMFLNEIRTHGVPDLDKVEFSGFNKRYRYRQQLMEDIRRRFREEYLGFLVHRNPKKQSSSELQTGDIVLVESDNRKKIHWPLGKILELYPSRDGISRSAKIKTLTGEIVRPVQRLYFLEISRDDEMPKLSESASEVITRSGRVVKVPNRLTY